VKDGKLDIMQPAPKEAWRGGEDPRGKITMDQLLKISSGLEFEEVYQGVAHSRTLQCVGIVDL